MARTVEIGAAQVAEVYMDAGATVEKDLGFVEEAGEEGLDLLVFPETHVPGNPIWQRFVDDSLEEFYRQLFENSVTVPGPEIDRYREAAAEAGVAIVAGVTEREPDTAGTMYNTAVVIDGDGELVGKRRKLTPTVGERIYHTGGTGRDVRTFDTAVGTVGSLLCSEHHNPLAVFATVAQGESLHAAQWPCFAWCDRDWRDRRVGVRSQYHALVGNVPTVVATGVLDDDLAAALDDPALSTDAGASGVLSPEGEWLAGPKWEGEGLVHAEVDLGERTWSKAVHDVTGHYNRFDVFTLEVDRSPQNALRVVGDSTTVADVDGDAVDRPTTGTARRDGDDGDPAAVLAAVRDAAADGDDDALVAAIREAAQRLQ